MSECAEEGEDRYWRNPVRRGFEEKFVTKLLLAEKVLEGIFSRPLQQSKVATGEQRIWQARHFEYIGA